MALALSSWWSRLRSSSAGERRFLVLTYHQVLEKPDPLRPAEIDRQALDQQVRELARHFRVRPLAETIRRAWDGSLEPATVCITFDDGYADNVRYGLPILQSHGVSATFFIASGYLRGRVMWNDLIIEAVRRTRVERLDAQDLEFGEWPLGSVDERRAAIPGLLGRAKYLSSADRERCATSIAQRLHVDVPHDLMMSGEDVARLARAGMDIGGHTVNHPILRSLDASGAEREITENRRELQALTEGPVQVFAYPNGKPGLDYDERDVALVRRSGFIGAVSTESRTASNRCDAFQLPRFGPWRESPARFRMRMLSLM